MSRKFTRIFDEQLKDHEHNILPLRARFLLYQLMSITSLHLEMTSIVDHLEYWHIILFHLLLIFLILQLNDLQIRLYLPFLKKSKNIKRNIRIATLTTSNNDVCQQLFLYRFIGFLD